MRYGRKEAEQDSGQRFQKRADIYIEDIEPIYCSDIKCASHRLNALNYVTEGIYTT